MSDKQHYWALCQILEEYNFQYHVLDAPTVSDAEYDRLFQELLAIERQHPEWFQSTSPSQRVGAKVQGPLPEHHHNVPMLSLDNAFSEDDVRDFYRRICERLGEALPALSANPSSMVWP